MTARHVHRSLQCIVLCALLCMSRSARADVERFGVFIGNNRGAPGEVELRYAESDAEKLHATMRALGDFAPSNIVLLKSESADTVRKTLLSINERVRAATSKPGSEVVLLVYYSGHADGTALHLGGSTLALSEVEQIVRGSAAEFRLLVLDSCRSGALTRVKGGTLAPPIDIRTDDRLSGEGTLFWTSSAANEDAQESDGIRGSFFSHYLNSALLGAGDTDADGRVTVEEAYRYASENTIRASSSSFGGTQHPTFRYELQGNGKLSLTTLWEHAKERGAIKVPAGKPYLIFADSSAGAVVGEIGTDDRARKVSVRPGTYFVRARAANALLEGNIRVGAGETRELRDDELSKTAYARLVRKGGVRESAFAVGAGLRAHSALPNGTGWCLGGYGEVALHWERLTGALRLGGCRAPFDSTTIDGAAGEATLEARIAKVFDLSFASPYVALDAGVALLHQSFHSTNRLTPSTTSGGLTAAGALGTGFDLPRGFSLSLEAGLALYIYDLEETSSRETQRQANLTLRPAVGLSKTW